MATKHRFRERNTGSLRPNKSHGGFEGRRSPALPGHNRLLGAHEKFPLRGHREEAESSLSPCSTPRQLQESAD